MLRRYNDSFLQSPLVQGGLDNAKFDVQSTGDPNAANVPGDAPYRLKLQYQEDADAPIPQASLRSLRFLFVVFFGIGIVVLAIYFILNGVTIERGVGDSIGSTSNADSRVAIYQTISGFFWAAMGLILEQYFHIFLAVMVTFLANSRWHPCDRPQQGNGGIKRAMIFWFPPVMMYLINIALSSVYIEHKVTGQRRSFVDADLVATATLSVSSLSVSNAESTSVLDTVLRSAILKKVVPFEIDADSPCGVDDLSKLTSGTKADRNVSSLVGNASTPGVVTNIVDIQSTSVGYAFPKRDWLLDAMPVALRPVSSFEVSAKSLNQKPRELEQQYASYLRENGLTTLTIFDMMLQGLVQFDRALSVSNTVFDYPCNNVDGLPDTAEAAPSTATPTSESTSGSASSASSSESSHSDSSAIESGGGSLDIEDRRLASRSRVLQGGDGSSPFEVGSEEEETTGEVEGEAEEIEEEEEDEDEQGSGEEEEDIYEDEYEDEYEEEEEEEETELVNVPDDSFQRYNNKDVDGDDFGKRKCIGAESSLPRFRQANRETLAGLFDSLASFEETIDLNTTLVKLETFEISPQVNVTAITIDLPFALDSAYYAGTGNEDWCDGNGRMSDPETYRELFGDDFDEVEKEFCDKTYYAIDGSAQCGSRNCVFKDESDVMGVKKQFTMTPYMTTCDPASLTYDHNVYSWFPGGCTKQSDAAFLFGLGSYVTGNFERRPGKGALITKPQRHYVVTFAKLTWRFEDLSTRFKAKCNGGQCDGLLHKLEKVSDAAPKAKDKAQVLMVGKKSIRTPHQNYTMRSPLTLVSLNTPKFYYATQGAESDDTYTYYTWEHLDLKFLNTTYKESDGLGLEKGTCSLIIDSFLDQVNKNHYYVSDPLQVLYTSAIYYLFQDAAVKEVELPSSNKLGVVDLSQAYIGSTRMKGDREKKEIKYSIPIVSAVSTFIGIVVLLVYSSIVLLVPQERVKENDETNFAAKYANVLIDDSYPKRVHRRRLVLPNGERIEMDEYGVESIRFAHEHEPDVKIAL